MLDDLRGDVHYVIKICAGTKSLSQPDEPPLLGAASNEKIVFLPRENCEAPVSWPTHYFQGELSAGMIAGAVCAVVFLLLAIIGFVVWR